jgi:hypothetical protein
MVLDLVGEEFTRAVELEQVSSGSYVLGELAPFSITLPLKGAGS